jgi:hypothetical protein
VTSATAGSGGERGVDCLPRPSHELTLESRRHMPWRAHSLSGQGIVREMVYPWRQMLSVHNNAIKTRHAHGVRSELRNGSGGGTRTHNLAVNSLTGCIPDGPHPSPTVPSLTRSSSPPSPIIPAVMGPVSTTCVTCGVGCSSVARYQPRIHPWGAAGFRAHPLGAPVLEAPPSASIAHVRLRLYTSGWQLRRSGWLLR